MNVIGDRTMKAHDPNIGDLNRPGDLLSTNNCENARTEYIAVQQAYIHYDNFAWQVGAVLIAGVFVYWGFIFSNFPNLLVLLIGNLLICSLMSIWVIYAEHNRQIYLYKLHRIHELEKILGMYQHRRFEDWSNEPKVYILRGPAGHSLNYAIYIIASLGGLLVYLFGKPGVGWQWCCYPTTLIVVNFSIVLAVVAYVWIVDNKVKKRIRQLWCQSTPESSAPHNLAGANRRTLQ